VQRRETLQYKFSVHEQTLKFPIGSGDGVD